MRHPHNAFDTFADEFSYDDEDCSVKWWQSEHCDQTYVLMLKIGDQCDIEVNVKFHENETFSLTSRFPSHVSDSFVNDYTKTLTQMLCLCIYDVSSV